MQFFEKLKFIRDSFDLNQSEFASKLGVTQSAYSKYERDERVADENLINCLISNFNINPNWLFLNKEEMIANDTSINFNNDFLETYAELSFLLTQDQIKERLNQILIQEIVKKVDIGEYSKPSKLLEILKLDDSKKARPFLFLWYIFHSISADKNKNAITNYKHYLIDKVSGFKVVSTKNIALFSEKMKNEIAAYFELNFSNDECKTLVQNAPITLKTLESMMPPSMVLSHRKNTK